MRLPYPHGREALRVRRNISGFPHTPNIYYMARRGIDRPAPQNFPPDKELYQSWLNPLTLKDGKCSTPDTSRFQDLVPVLDEKRIESVNKDGNHKIVTLVAKRKSGETWRDNGGYFDGKLSVKSEIDTCWVTAKYRWVDGAEFENIKSGNTIVNSNTKLPQGWFESRGYLLGPTADLRHQDLSGITIQNVDLSRAKLDDIKSQNLVGTTNKLPPNWSLHQLGGNNNNGILIQSQSTRHRFG